MKNNKFTIAIIIILSLALIGSVGYMVITKLNENDKQVDNNKQEDNKLNDTEALTIGTKLYNELTNYFYNEHIIYDTDYSNYIDSDIDARCSLGIGCMPITNWSELASILSDTYKFNKEALENYGVEIIDNKPYIIDGFEPSYGIIDYTLEIKTYNNKEIVFKVNLNTTEGTKIKKLTIVEEGNEWKIKDFD